MKTYYQMQLFFLFHYYDYYYYYQLDSRSRSLPFGALEKYDEEQKTQIPC